MTTTSQDVERARQSGQVSQARLFRLVNRVRELGLLVVLLLIILFVGIQAPRFLSIDNFEQILLSIAILVIVAVGETLVVLTRNVDLSVGSMVGVTAFVTAYFFKQLPGVNLLLGILLGCALGLVLGMINGLIVSFGRVPAIVATLGTLYAYRGLVFVFAANTTSQVNASDVPSSYLALATTQIFGIPALILIAAVIAIIVGYYLHASPTGRQLYAIGSNPEAASMIGIRRDWLVFATFAASGLLCGASRSTLGCALCHCRRDRCHRSGIAGHRCSCCRWCQYLWWLGHYPWCGVGCDRTGNVAKCVKHPEHFPVLVAGDLWRGYPRCSDT